MGIKANWSGLRKDRNVEEMETTSVNPSGKFSSEKELKNIAGAGGRNQENRFLLVGVIKSRRINWWKAGIFQEEGPGIAKHGLESLCPSGDFDGSWHAPLLQRKAREYRCAKGVLHPGVKTGGLRRQENHDTGSSRRVGSEHLLKY